LQTKHLTLNKKAKFTPILKERDYDDQESWCIYCGGRFIESHTSWCREWEHLNNNSECNEDWNLVWAHAICNEKKKYDFDMQGFAQELAKKNKKWFSESMRGREKKQPTAEATEIDLNVAHMEITEQFLTEKLPDKNKRHLLLDAINCIALRCKKQTGHGSAQSVRNYLNILSCSEGNHEIRKIEGKNYIFQRS